MSAFENAGEILTEANVFVGVREIIDQAVAESAGNGGSMPAFSGALVRLSAAASGLANADTIPFDVVEADSDGYFNAGNHSFVIPTGKAGLYLIGAMLIVDGGNGFTLDSGLIGILVGDDTDVSLCPSFDIGAAFVTGSMILSYAEGGAIVPKISFSTDGPAKLEGGVNGSRFFCQWLGPLPT